jgi:protein ImuB
MLCSRQAARSGIRPGMPVAEAVAVECALHVQEKEPEKDVQALGRLAEWLTRYSPIVGLEEGPFPQSLILDVSGCAACFHGEKNLLRRATRELANESWVARIALADTVGAAWALAHFADTPSGETERVLLPLPVAALRLPSETVDALGKLGIEKVGQLTALSRSSIPARFGETVLRRLDQAMGRAAEVFAPHRPPPVVDANCPFDYPSDHPEQLHYALDQLTKRITAALRRHHLGARRIECWLYSEEAEPVRIEIVLCQPSDSVRHIGALIRTRLERTLFVGAVCGMSMRVIAAEPIPDLQSEFFETDRPHVSQDLSVLIDRLSSRLGPEAVTRAVLIPDPQPEFACRFDSIQHSDEWRVKSGERKRPARHSQLSILHSSLVTHHSSLAIRRPVRLWPTPVRIEVVSTVPEGPPIRFWWKGVEYRVTCSRGPERIETGWWRGQDVRRDYYAVATQAGSRFWIFRRREDSRWFLHGCFD